ncbi:hypothetical protein GN956_G3143 [Arapaima gigas]
MTAPRCCELDHIHAHLYSKMQSSSSGVSCTAEVLYHEMGQQATLYTKRKLWKWRHLPSTAADCQEPPANVAVWTLLRPILPPSAASPPPCRAKLS